MPSSKFFRRAQQILEECDASLSLLGECLGRESTAGNLVTWSWRGLSLGGGSEALARGLVGSARFGAVVGRGVGKDLCLEYGESHVDIIRRR